MRTGAAAHHVPRRGVLVRRLWACAPSGHAAALAAGLDKGGPDHEEPVLRDQEVAQLRLRHE